ncbi:MAG TPA: SgcJ/EcaC family oxidoreductase [Sphingomicrobium sp.]|nr:SgcJ/EcaC family oxidoreductase [Sphingomicrobium sp.]
MRRPFLVLVIALGSATQAPAAELTNSDRQQPLQLAKRMDHAWTAGDANSNAQLFAPDATARFGDDPLGEGREAILIQFAGFFKDRPAGLRHVTNIERAERLTGDLAMWDAEVRVKRRQADGRWATLTRIRNVTIAVRQPDGWRIKTVRAFPVSK